MNEPIFIKNLFGIDAIIARRCDKDGNGILECTDQFDEISLFNIEKANFKKNGEILIFEQQEMPQNTMLVTDSQEVQFTEEETVIQKAPQILDRKFSISSSATQKPNTTYDAEVMKEALDSILKDNSKMKGTAEAFINYAQKDTFSKKLDPIVLMSIAMHESAKGMSKAAQQKNNIGGIMGSNGLRRFDNVESCVDSIANTINKRVTEGYSSINSIAHSGRYCARNAASTWSANVVVFAEQLRQKYNELLIKKYEQQTTLQNQLK